MEHMAIYWKNIGHNMVIYGYLPDLVNVYSLRTRTSPSFRSVNQRTFDWGHGFQFAKCSITKGYANLWNLWENMRIKDDPQDFWVPIQWRKQMEGMLMPDVANCDKIYLKSHGLLHVPKGEPPFSFSILG